MEKSNRKQNGNDGKRFNKSNIVFLKEILRQKVYNNILMLRGMNEMMLTCSR